MAALRGGAIVSDRPVVSLLERADFSDDGAADAHNHARLYGCFSAERKFADPHRA
jgi:hypothetical protein